MKNKNEISFFTYKLNRRCDYCDEPIADQVHKSRKHCPREVMPDGSIKCCKDDKHSSKRSKKDQFCRTFEKHHEKMHENIEQLFKIKGPTVCLTDINNYGIILKRPLEFSTTGGLYTFYFQGYKIAQIDNNNYKIETYGRIL